MEKSRFKFRAWDKSNNVMVENVGINEDGDGIIAYATEGYEYISSDVMQYTGLKDNNLEKQKEVYDGDIVECLNGNSGVVEWDYKNTGWIVRSLNQSTKVWSLVDSLINGALVIGNKYENKELLEGEIK